MKFVARATSEWDQYTQYPDYWTKNWINQNLFRLMSFAPYWNSRLSWDPNVWIYQDLYGTWGGSDITNNHWDWILKDSSGNPLYIPFACWGSGCNLYAVDPGNPNFQQYWINNVRNQLSAGYKGVWIDDVNMEYRVGYGDGSNATPIDPRTGQQMSYTAWKSYIASFVQNIRRNLGGYEIVHNAIWYGGGNQRDYDPSVITQIQSADYINLERGISDGGLTGGNGPWSVNAFLSYIDHVHQLGKHVIVDEYWFNGQYNSAGYFLINDGNDGFGNEQVRPWYTDGSYGVDLGNAHGGRYSWNGLLRRDFDNGVVLLNLPGSGWIGSNMGNMKRTDGSGGTAGTVWLYGGQGAILTY